ncbi:LysM peptidoglycan-binding domain-containing protein [Lachnospira hominis (ex Liu et al. 2021)]|uniref:LysM peptidoglycan-binding domain-containing protein n=1 Tax=Lachnospira hominis (ex Liu et al. 2021) TaxID=2763051 RepID=A0ABR7G2N7_9FIRM|nr:LysM peptidoglycan-binding domain-containing protein [Lachnospira hominis]MBC5681695.1 LysM peptidoglycan-binding domain-containing protein [Lachnospira hominis]
MIEIICNGEDDSNKGNMRGNADIRRPKNIKQIGDVSSNRKIYIEDYAFTYINSVAYQTPEDEQAGVLLGEVQKSDEEKCLFIKGVIRAKTPENETKQGIVFNEKIWEKIYAEIEKFFPDLEVVGWFAAMPGITQERFLYLKKLHMDNFSGGMKTMYLVNTCDKEENFYLYENGELKKQKGYVCFYERNYEMQEYMLERRERKPIESPEKDKVMKSIRSIIQEKEEMRQRRKNSVFLYGISSFMAVVVLVIGINLLNSYEKMKKFDTSLSNIALEISNISEKEKSIQTSDNSVSVNKISGDVYPTEAETESTESRTTRSQTEQSQTEKQAESAEMVKEADAAQTTYIVKKGDTIMSICKKYYGNTEKLNEIIAVNNIEDADKLYIGQEIKLP